MSKKIFKEREEKDGGEGWKSDSSNISHLSLLPDCSLEIKQPVLNDSQLYTCGSGALHSNVSLLKLELSERKDPEEGTIELHCFLSTFIGAFHCHNTVGIHIKWSTEDNTPINGLEEVFAAVGESVSLSCSSAPLLVLPWRGLWLKNHH
ncbi:hypothetical protein INR49_024638 [Caranx melampygus]|nr:hypothetical protein INR49_024638 [Caranx melampygus]